MPPVVVRRESVVIPTYLPCAPDRHPMFLEKRVYQGSSGKVYPLPFIGRIAGEPIDRAWDAIYLENEFLEIMILPEIGGRIHAGRDKTNGYDFFYRQNVIKPALVGLAGPWISGGVEFNWPQHHRPATFMPVDFEIEEEPDGSRTIWMSDHDPMSRMKGMHGVRLSPGRAVVELRVRAYNRTPHVQTFLWWANVAARVHEQYQSFFPPDVTHVADHARRAMTEYPLSHGAYYGIDYGARAKSGVPTAEPPAHFVPPASREPGHGLVDYPANDLGWYANIPVPTSYMCVGSKGNFFGGYDHAARAGLVHVANPHISPGKKQWTWGNHEFGYAWDRNLTDADGPYIELMAGVYTDNQPDFSFLQPGETKTWSQLWYPIQDIGPAQHAGADGALSLRVEKRTARLGVSVTTDFPGATVRLTARDQTLAEFPRDLRPGKPLVETVALPKGIRPTDLTLLVLAEDGREILVYQPQKISRAEAPAPATEPPLPAEITSLDELYLTGIHLAQYRHATRAPEPYWREALRRDPLDSRCNLALGVHHLHRGEFTIAEKHLRTAIERLTARNGNPADGEAHYQLGLCLRHLGRDDEAYAAFYKAVWNQAWQSAGYHALAEIDCRRHDWLTALDHLHRSLRLNTDNLRAHNLRTLVLRKLNRDDDANVALRETLALDPLDWWARDLAGLPLTCDAQTKLDLAWDHARAGFFDEALAVLNAPSTRPDDPRELGARPLIGYTLGWLHEQLAQPAEALAAYRAAASEAPDYCFPSRLEEIAILEGASRANPADARAPSYLGNLLYDRLRHAEAITAWERSAKLDPDFSIVWRNLGIGFFNILQRPASARQAYDRAFRADPADARLLYERDQLWKRLAEPPRKRLRELQRHPDLVATRDDLTVELCALRNLTGKPDEALALLLSRQFQPWEGGEGQALGAYVNARLALGRNALAASENAEAVAHFTAALVPPRNLAEARHLLANQSDIHFWLGEAHAAADDKRAAGRHWKVAADFRGDFQSMSVRAYSEMTVFSALSLQRLGRRSESKTLLNALLDYAKELRRTEAKIDYFATSLPTMLLFDDDLQFRQTTTALFLRAQAEFALGRRKAARTRLTEVLSRDPSHAGATDLLSQI